MAVHPAHGKGSFCGGGIGAKPSTTIGEERVQNPALAVDRRAFVERKAPEADARTAAEVLGARLKNQRFGI